MNKLRQIDVTKRKEVSGFFKSLSRFKKPVEIVLEGQVVGRLVPPGKLSAAKKEQLLRRGRELVQKARARTVGVSARELGKLVDRAVKRVRAEQ